MAGMGMENGKARAALARVLGWRAERLLIAHGECVQSGAGRVIERALHWI